MKILDIIYAKEYSEIANNSFWMDKAVHHMPREEVNILLGFLLKNYRLPSNASDMCGCEFCLSYSTLKIGQENAKQAENKIGVVQL